MSTGDPVVSSVFAAEGFNILQLQCVSPEQTGRRGVYKSYIFSQHHFIITGFFFLDAHGLERSERSDAEVHSHI